MGGLFKTEQPKPIIQRDREDEAIQNAARESRKRPLSLRGESLLTAGPMMAMASPILRRATAGG